MSLVDNSFDTTGRVRRLHNTEGSFDIQNIREDERIRIAREIHDELGQWLTALKLEAYLIRKTISIEDKAMQEKLSAMDVLISEMVKSVSRIAAGLRPSILNNLGLVAALKWQGQEFEKRTGIQSQVLSNGNDHSLELNMSINIFRVYQEALNNIARHANATLVETFIEQTDAHVILIIKDNGRGFNLNEVKMESSWGLVGMRERALMLQGELIIERNSPTGIAITLKAPLISKSGKIDNEISQIVA